LIQREGGDDAQLARRIGLDAAVQRVHEGVGLANGQRNAEHDVARNGVEHVVNGRFEGIDEEGLGHGCLQVEQSQTTVSL
jgi:predicted metal-dependent phosphoesterase TrpH